MKDIPLFTTQNGAAGLTLREIPYRQKAYITIHETKNLPQLLDECTDFCKAVGAEEVYACNHAELTQYPVSTRILEMVCPLCDVPQVNARLRIKQRQRYWRSRALRLWASRTFCGRTNG